MLSESKMKSFLRDAAVGVDGKIQANADCSLVKDNEQVNNSRIFKRTRDASLNSYFISLEGNYM